MKYLLVLTLLVACSTKDKEVSKPAPEATATETEAKPVSPYTVQPCYCMKIYQPVCANGVTFGNSCEAECQGHKKWTEGTCSKK